MPGFTLVLPFQIDAEWERIGALLAPAIVHDHSRQAIDVYRDLMAGDLALFWIEMPEAQGIAVVEIAKPEFLLIYISGKIAGRPREWRERVRLLMSEFETIARAHGCTELRIEGRDWGRIFPEWARQAERPDRNELRKVL